MIEYCKVKGVKNINEDRWIASPKLSYSYSGPFVLDDLPMVIDKEVVASNDPNFCFDIEYSYLSNPRVKLTLIGESQKEASEYIIKAHEWFKTPQYGRRFFDYVNSVVVEIGDIQENKKVKGSNEHTEQFDVILQFSKVIKVRENTIETFNITDFDYKNNY